MRHAPSAEECDVNSQVFEDEDYVGYAAWYPSMGGHPGKSIIVMQKEWVEIPETGARLGGCFTVWLWHGGEFLLSDEQEPQVLHHCEPNDFIVFGHTVARLLASHKKREGVLYMCCTSCGREIPFRELYVCRVCHVPLCSLVTCCSRVSLPGSVRTVGLCPRHAPAYTEMHDRLVAIEESRNAARTCVFEEWRKL